MNRKGSLVDIMYVSIIIVIFAVSSIIGYMVLDKFSSTADEQQLLTGNSINILQQQTSRFPLLFNGLFLFLFIGVNLSVLIAAFMIRTHPVFYLISLVILLIITFINTIFAEMFNKLSTNSVLSAYSAHMGLMNFMMSKFPFFILILSFLIAAVMYAKGN